ncbi:MAG: GldG family protein [Thermodesulfobacteriota bacterium]|nr:GldG family protein [Thermodesulfobacteriota bacterium]
MNTLKSSLKGTNTVVYIISVIGITVLINLLSYNNFYRFDLSSQKSYSLSKASKKLMQNLKDPVNIKAFFSTNLPPPFNSNRRYIRDLLDEFRAYSHGKLNYTFIDPEEDIELKKEAQSLGIMEVQLTNVSRDKFMVNKAFMGLAFIYREKNETIGMIKNTDNLEYEITSLIKKLVSKEEKRVGLFIKKEKEEEDPYERIKNFSNGIESLYKTLKINIEEDPLPGQLDSLIVVGPYKDFTDWEIFQIDQFILKGGPTAFLLNRVKIDNKRMTGTRGDDKIFDLLENYGVRINADLILDLQCQRVSVSQPRGKIVLNTIVQYPFFPLITNFNRDNIMTREQKNIVLNYVSSLTPLNDRIKEANLKYEPVIETSKKAWKLRNYFPLSPFGIKPPKGTTDYKAYTLACILSGGLKSYFQDREIPELESKDGKDEDSNKKNELITKGDNSRIFIISNSYFIENRNFTKSNAVFAMNMVDWLCQDEEMINIRNKGITIKPLGNVSFRMRNFIKYFNILFLPALVIILGLFMWKVRSLKKRRYTRAFQ